MKLFAAAALIAATVAATAARAGWGPTPAWCALYAGSQYDRGYCDGMPLPPPPPQR